MYELIRVSKHDYYMESPARVGLIELGGGEVALIDSGSDKDAGRKIRGVLEKEGWRLNAIYNTHSNADHIGGNRYLAAQTGCRIYAYGAECAFTRHPILEPSYLYGGYPMRELRHKFLLAEPSEALPLCDECLPSGVSVIPLPGHFFDMVGFRTAEDTVYLADCLSSRETLEKYGIGVIYDVEAYLTTLERVKGMEARLFVPAHAAPCEDIAPLAQYNIDKVHEVAERIATLLAEPHTTDGLLTALFNTYGLAMNHQQYALVGSTVRSYLSWLSDKGEISACFENNCLLWRTK